MAALRAGGARQREPARDRDGGRVQSRRGAAGARRAGAVPRPGLGTRALLGERDPPDARSSFSLVDDGRGARRARASCASADGSAPRWAGGCTTRSRAWRAWQLSNVRGGARVVPLPSRLSRLLRAPRRAALRVAARDRERRPHPLVRRRALALARGARSADAVRTTDCRGAPNPEMDAGRFHAGEPDAARRHAERHVQSVGGLVSARRLRARQRDDRGARRRRPPAWARRRPARSSISAPSSTCAGTTGSIPPPPSNLRVVLGGWVSGDPLPLERRLSIDGPGTVPGFDFRSGGVGDVGTCAHVERAAGAAGAVRAHRARAARVSERPADLLLQRRWRRTADALPRRRGVDLLRRRGTRMAGERAGHAR